MTVQRVQRVCGLSFGGCTHFNHNCLSLLADKHVAGTFYRAQQNCRGIIDEVYTEAYTTNEATPLHNVEPDQLTASMATMANPHHSQ